MARYISNHNPANLYDALPIVCEAGIQPLSTASTVPYIWPEGLVELFHFAGNGCIFPWWQWGRTKHAPTMTKAFICHPTGVPSGQSFVWTYYLVWDMLAMQASAPTLKSCVNMNNDQKPRLRHFFSFHIFTAFFRYRNKQGELIWIDCSLGSDKFILRFWSPHLPRRWPAGFVPALA